eukprot:10190883-Alexandrium_andersonii.AAC.1
MGEQELRGLEAVHAPEVLDRLDPSLERREGRQAQGLHEVVGNVRRGFIGDEPHRPLVLFRK